VSRPGANQLYGSRNMLVPRAASGNAFEKVLALLPLSKQHRQKTGLRR
jgi:hypothetical protein